MRLRACLVQLALILLVLSCCEHSQVVAGTEKSPTPKTIPVQWPEVNSSEHETPKALDRRNNDGAINGLMEKSDQSYPNKLEATIINPVRSADIAAEVGGIIENYNFEIGDRVRKGQIVLEISRKRYALAAQKAKQNLDALRLALRRAQKEKEIKDRLLSMGASSQQELLRAETEFEVTEHKVREAETTVQQSLLDLEACQVKAPFTGYLAVRYKEPFEAVGPLEKIFGLVDSSKVYAVTYVPESSMPLFGKGSKAAFTDSSGKRFVGQVAKIEPVIDPKTGTRKIYVLIDNPEEQLEIGMTGSLQAIK